jgi:hypothetical protein
LLKVLESKNVCPLSILYSNGLKPEFVLIVIVPSLTAIGLTQVAQATVKSIGL